MAHRPTYEVYKSDIDGNEIEPLFFEKVNYKKKMNKIPTFYFTINRNAETELSAPIKGDKIKIIRNYQPVLLGEIENVEVRENTFYFEGRSVAKEFENFIPLERMTLKKQTVRQHVGMMSNDVQHDWDVSNVSDRHIVTSFQYNFEDYLNRLQAMAEMKNLNFKFVELPRQVHMDTEVGEDKSQEVVLVRGRNFDEIKVQRKQNETWDFVIALGKGDGKNQLMTTAGRPENRKKTKVFTDKQIENMKDLQSFADSKLEEGSEPESITYEMRVDNSLFNFDLGDSLWVDDFKNGIDGKLRTYEIDVTFNKTEQVDIVLANRRRTLASYLKNLEKGQRTLENVQHSSAVQAGAMIQVDEDYNPVKMEVQNDNFVNTSSGKSIGDIEDDIAAKESSIIKQPSAPSSPEDGDLWLDLASSPNLLKRWDAEQNDWLRTSAMTAEEIGAENKIYRLPTAPTDTDALWLDVSTVPYKLMRHDGSTWVKATPTNADEIDETASKKWAGESGADITGNNTANDTANVNGVPAGTVKDNAQAGRDAKSKLEQEVADKIIETVEGATAKANTAKNEALNSAVSAAKEYTDNNAVAQSDYDTKMLELEGDISNKVAQTAYDNKVADLNSNISSKVAQADYDTKVSQIESNVSDKVAQADYDSKVASIDSAVDSNSTSITSNSTEIATKASQTEVNGLGNRLSTAETSISENAQEIALKATQDEVDTISGDLSSAKASITLNSEAISSKVEQTDFNNLSGEVSNAKTSISQNATAITSKASQSEVNDLGNRIGNAETSISQNSSDIDLKASQSEVDTISGDLSSAQASININAEAISSKVEQTDFNNLSGKVDTAETNITQNATDISSKASKTSVNALGTRMGDAETAIDQNATDISLKASQSEVDTISGDLSDAQASINVNATAISSKVEQTDFNNLSGEVDNAQTSISQNATAITSKASQSSVNALGNRMDSAETSISQNSSDIELKASQSSLDSTNQSLSEAQASINVNSNAITSKVEQTDFNNLSNTVESNSTSISQNSSAIDLKASQSDLDDATGRISSNESTLSIQDDRISSKVESTEYNGAMEDIDSFRKQMGVAEKVEKPIFTRPTEIDFYSQTLLKDEPRYIDHGLLIDRGAGENLEIPTKNLFSPIEGTIEFTIKPTVMVNYINLFRMDISTGRFTFYMTSSGYCKFGIGGVGEDVESDSGAAKVNESMRVALRWSVKSGVYTLFINGEKIGDRVFERFDSFPSKVDFIREESIILQDLRISSKARKDSEIL